MTDPDTDGDPERDHGEGTFEPPEYDQEFQGYLQSSEADQSPAEWWDVELGLSRDADSLQRWIEALVSFGCPLPDLLVALRSAKHAFQGLPVKRADLVRELRVLEQPMQAYPLVMNDEFRLDDWFQLEALRSRYAEELRREAARLKRNPQAERKAALLSFLSLVDRKTGAPRLQLVTELLHAFVDSSLTYDNIRQYVSRAELPACRAARLKVPPRPKTTKGRDAAMSGQTLAKLYSRARREAGVRPDDDR